MKECLKPVTHQQSKASSAAGFRTGAGADGVPFVE